MTTKKHDDLSPTGKCMEVVDSDNGIGILSARSFQRFSHDKSAGDAAGKAAGEAAGEGGDEIPALELVLISKRDILGEMHLLDEEDSELLEEVEMLFVGKR